MRNTNKKELHTIYRRNFVERKVCCGYLSIEEDRIIINLDNKVESKYQIPNFKYQIEFKNKENMGKFIHLEGGVWFLNDFKRRLKVKSKNKKKKGKYTRANELKSPQQIKKEDKQRILDNKIKEKAIKKQIIENSKSKIKLKVDIFKDCDTLGTLGDFFKKDSSVVDAPFKEQELENSDTQAFLSLKKKSISKKKDKVISDTLVLWDIENVHFYNDFSYISKYVPKDAIKIFSYAKKNHKQKIYLKGDKLDFVLNKLRKRGWIEKRTTKIADQELIEEFNARANKIKKLYLISADKDFQNICEKATELNIEVHIINNEHRNKFSWFNKEDYNYHFIRKRHDY